ncbi:MAG: hypothetical protein ACK5GN_10425 [Pseudomonadota bacterium]|jgi:hypothetical protein
MRVFLLKLIVVSSHKLAYLGAQLVIIASITAQLASAQIAGTQGITAVFSTGQNELAAYDASLKQLRFFSVLGGAAQETSKIAVPGQVMGVLAVGDSYVIATGMGRGDLTPPIRVHTVTKSILKNSTAQLQLVYERVTERPQITQLRQCGNSVVIGFFESKYNTIIGDLAPSAAGAGGLWSFTQRAALRMGDSFDCVDGKLLVGRSYGDSQGQDGDLLLIDGNTRTLLPSYRGVRGVESIGDSRESMLIIGDGWHPNYGEMAQGRISLLRRINKDSRFALEIIDLDSKNFNFTKFRQLTLASGKGVAALGSSQVVVYRNILGKPEKEVVYTQIGTTHMLDFAVAATGPSGSILAVADEGLRLVVVDKT